MLAEVRYFIFTMVLVTTTKKWPTPTAAGFVFLGQAAYGNAEE